MSSPVERMRFGPDELTLRDHEGNVTLDGAAEQAERDCTEIDRAFAEVEAMRAEINEQCRLNGMGSEREARLMARVDELARERDALQVKVNAFYGGNPQGGFVARLEAELSALKAQAGEPSYTWEQVFRAANITKRECKHATGMHVQIDTFVNASQIAHDVCGTDHPTTERRVIDLSCVINWLENGCDVKEAVKELRSYQAKLNAALEQPAEVEPVASIYINAHGEREFDDWKVDLPKGRNILYTNPTDAAAQIAELKFRNDRLVQDYKEAQEQITKLEAERRDMMTKWGHCVGEKDEIKRNKDDWENSAHAWKAEAEKLEADAARYQWLRDKAIYVDPEQKILRICNVYIKDQISPMTLDAAVDAALEKTK